MSIPQHTIDHILDRIDLVDLINTRVKLKKSGKTYTACCPFHQEKTPSFHVDGHKGFYHCFGCQAKGNAINFLMQYENRQFIDVMEDLAQQAGIELPKHHQEDKTKFAYKKNQPKRPSAQPKKNHTAQPNNNADHTHNSTAPSDDFFANAVPVDTFDPMFDPFDLPAPTDFDEHVATSFEEEDTSAEGNLYDLLEHVALFYEQQLSHNTQAQHYVSNRGIDQHTKHYWRLGYAPEGWQHLEQHFPHDIDGLKAVGLIRQSDNGRDYNLLRDRVIFPIRNHKGRVVGFGGRALNNDIKPKYINSPESVVFQKSQILYGLYEGRQAKSAQWLMVEGYMDVIALQQAGLSGAVASLGTATNVEHLHTLFKQNNKITLAFDGDAAGQRAAWRTLELALPILTDGRALHFLVLPTQHDPDSLVRLEGLSGLKNRIEQAPPLSDFLYSTLAQQIDTNSPEGKSHLMNEAKKLSALLPAQGSFRRLLDQSLRERLGLGWKNKQSTSPQQLLSFEQSCSLEEKALLLLLQYPALFSHMTTLVELADSNHAFGRALYLMKQAEEELPDDPEQALYFMLGAWPIEQERNKLCHLLDAVDMGAYVQQPERLEGLCEELVLQLTAQYLNQKMNTANSIQARQALKTQLLEIRKKLYFRESVR